MENKRGIIAQLGERLNGIQEVMGSNGISNGIDEGSGVAKFLSLRTET